MSSEIENHVRILEAFSKVDQALVSEKSITPVCQLLGTLLAAQNGVYRAIIMVRRSSDSRHCTIYDHQEKRKPIRNRDVLDGDIAVDKIEVPIWKNAEIFPWVAYK